MAVVIYMVLMSGLYPYVRCGGGDPAKNLKSGKCPLDKNSGVRLPVSWYKSVSWLTPGLKGCFLRMFGEVFSLPAQRPLLDELRNELVHFIEVMKTSRSENQRQSCPQQQEEKMNMNDYAGENTLDVTNPAPRCPVMLLLDTSGSMGDCIDELRTRGGSRLPRKRVRLHHRLRRRVEAPYRLLPGRRRAGIPDVRVTEHDARTDLQPDVHGLAFGEFSPPVIAGLPDRFALVTRSPRKRRPFTRNHRNFGGMK